jgi:6-phosphogluconolactonase
MDLDVYPTDAEAFEATAERAAAALRAAVAARGRAAVALSGGRGGRGVLRALAARGDVPWERIDWWWADERCVPADDPRSNVRLARENLLVPRGIAAAHIHPPPVELGEPDRIAAAYAAALTAALGDPPVFDLVLLGMGANGHVASLMPKSAALRATAAVAAVPASEVQSDPPVARITLTVPVLRAARRVLVTATGEEKARALASVLTAPDDPERLPAQLVRPSATVAWCVDRAAAAELVRSARPGD